MIKYYLKNTDKEVKVGDRITISVPTSTPYGQGKCDIEVLVTQETLNHLVDDNLVVKKDDGKFDFEVYKPFVRRIARKHDVSFPEACELLDGLREISMPAHNALLLEAMSEVFNRDKTVNSLVFVLNSHGRISRASVEGIVVPYFIEQADALKAISLMKPFYNGK